MLKADCTSRRHVVGGLVLATLFPLFSFSQPVTRVTLRTLVGGRYPLIATDSSGATIIATEVERTETVPTEANHFKILMYFDTYIGKISPTGAYTLLVKFLDTPPSKLLVNSSDEIIFAGKDTVAKIAPNGTVIWKFTLRSTPTSIALDKDGDIWIVGTAPGFSPTADAFQSSPDPRCSPNGNLDCAYFFVAKLSSDGSKMIYGSLLGGAGQNSAAALAIDHEGGIWIAGATDASDFPVTHDALQSKFAGPTKAQAQNRSWWGDGFLLKLDPVSGRPTYSTYLGGSAPDRISAVAVSSLGDIFVGGTTFSSDIPAAAAEPRHCQVTLNGCVSGFYAAFDPSGHARFVKYNQSTNSTDALADADGGFWFTASTGLTQCQPVSEIVHLDSEGVIIERRPSLYMYISALASDAAGRIHAAGNGASAYEFLNGAQSVSNGAVMEVLDFTLEDEFEPQCIASTAPAYFGTKVSPGELALITGFGLGPGSRVWIGERELTAVSSTPTTILVAIPPDLDTGVPTGSAIKAPLVVRRGQYSAGFTVSVVLLTPAFFMVDGTYLAVSNQDGTANTASNPALIGSVVSFYGTGFGALNAQNQLAIPYDLWIEAFTAGNADKMEILYAGLAPGLPGVYQLNARIPPTAKPGEPAVRMVFELPYDHSHVLSPPYSFARFYVK